MALLSDRSTCFFLCSPLFTFMSHLICIQVHIHFVIILPCISDFFNIQVHNKLNDNNFDGNIKLFKKKRSFNNYPDCLLIYLQKSTLVPEYVYTYFQYILVLYICIPTLIPIRGRPSYVSVILKAVTMFLLVSDTFLIHSLIWGKNEKNDISNKQSIGTLQLGVWYWISLVTSPEF